MVSWTDSGTDSFIFVNWCWLYNGLLWLPFVVYFRRSKSSDFKVLLVSYFLSSVIL